MFVLSMCAVKNDNSLKKMTKYRSNFEKGDCMNKEREKRILEILLQEERVYVRDLAKRLYASEPSVRRDLINLEKQGFLRRIHGGAVLLESIAGNDGIPFAIREYEQADEKIVIAKKAAELVNDGDVVMLDASSSVFALIPFLAKKSNLTVVTSSVKVLEELSELPIKTYSTGGVLLPACLSLVGHDALKMLDGINADIAFFSCRGVSADGWLTDTSVEEDLIRQKMIEKSRRQYLLCASEKFGNIYFHNLCSLREITGIISERELPEELKRLAGEKDKLCREGCELYK